jgi:methyltransferase (TIGR00027 family)/uncharacterized protein (TIGR02246 family)
LAPDAVTAPPRIDSIGFPGFEAGRLRAGAFVTAQQDPIESGAARLYRQLLDAWNRRDAADMAALFTPDGSLVGFDGSQVDGGPAAVRQHLAPIFNGHATPAYVGKVREVRALAPSVSLVRAVAGMVPEGRRELNTALNTIHSLVAVEAGGQWRASIFQSTPAAFHGRPELTQALSAELRELLPQPAAGDGAGPEPALSGVGNTARWIAATRAMESELALPLFSDPYARELSGEEGFKLQTLMRAAMGAQGAGPDIYLSIRTKYLDDAILHAVRSRNLHQVVLLAAGMDTRAFRIPWPSSVRLFEVDRDEIFNHKEAVLARAGASPACDRRIVRADLAQPWTAALIGAGFDRSKPAAFLVEGLMMYLEESEALRLMGWIREIAAPGSWLASDIINPEVMTSPYMARYMNALREAGSPWKFGISEPEQFYAAYGWTATVVMPGDPEASYGRWPFPTAPRAIPGIPRTFFVTATRTS